MFHTAVLPVLCVMFQVQPSFVVNLSGALLLLLLLLLLLFRPKIKAVNCPNFFVHSLDVSYLFVKSHTLNISDSSAQIQIA